MKMLCIRSTKPEKVTALQSKKKLKMQKDASGVYVYMRDSKIRVQCWGSTESGGMKAGDYPWR
jgi:hypothetical protein